MNKWIYTGCIIIFWGCNFTHEDHVNAAIEELRKETDSLKNELNVFKVQQHRKDSLENITKQKVISSQDIVVKKSIHYEKNKTEKKVVQQKVIQSKKSDTTFYFYTHTKKISVRIDPVTGYGKSKIRFYNLKGEVMFEQEDVRKSYSVSTDIKEFHPNGAVKRIVIHLNPDASMHWYETRIEFDTDNTPLWKEEITYPLTLDGMMNNRSDWDAAKKQWVKQETTLAQP